MAEHEYRWNGQVDETAQGISVYDFLRKRNHWSRRFLRRLKEQGEVFLNGQRIPYLNISVSVGDTVVVQWREVNAMEWGSTAELAAASPELILPEIEILYEDEDLIVVNKPCGWLVHPVRFQRGNTIQETLIAQFAGEMMRPVHRLDRETSGVLLFARNALAHQQIGEQFRKQRVQKRYVAVALGWVQSERMDVTEPIAVHPEQPSWRVVSADGQAAHTTFEVQARGYWQGEAVTLLNIWPHTGRTHQIRVHAMAMGHPLVGDEVYGGAECRALADRVCLHAAQLKVLHPRSKTPMEWHAPVPSDWKVT